VVGGGLAGCAAALDLVEAGHDVTLLEARPTLGGAVQTLPERTGDPSPPPDNGQHIALGCFTEYLGFLTRLGSAGSLRRSLLSLPVQNRAGRWAEISSLTIALGRYAHLPLRERTALRSLMAMRGADPTAHDHETFADYLRGTGQTERAIDRFWDVFIRPALNLPAREVSASMGIFTVKTALLSARHASDVLLPTAPLGSMHGDAARTVLERLGARVETGARIGDLGEVDADAIVLAVPPRESAQLLEEPEPALEESPIISVHLLFDRPILRHPLVALLGSDAHWIFDRGALTGNTAGDGGTSRFPPTPSPGPLSRTGGFAAGQYLTVVSSGAPELMELRARELVDRIAGQLTDRLGSAELLWSRVSREPRATVALRPGTAALRPGPRTSHPNVVRAGAWTNTGWPATMESAVRSGRTAARVLVDLKTKVVA
jgi:squalene-associated FAD-dependent desaturase